jgi:hypothetical protein
MQWTILQGHTGVRNALYTLTLTGVLLTTACTSPDKPQAYRGGETGAGAASTCAEPENPYDPGGGHYAGYEWAEEHQPAACGGSSQSFVEGCEEYQEQQADYEECEERQKK